MTWYTQLPTYIYLFRGSEVNYTQLLFPCVNKISIIPFTFSHYYYYLIILIKCTPTLHEFDFEQTFSWLVASSLE